MAISTPYLSSVAHKKGVLLLSVGTASIASFPAWLNAGKMPTIEDVSRLCGLTPAGSETVEMTGNQLSEMLDTVPASAVIDAKAETVCVSVRNMQKGVTAFPITARLINECDIWQVTCPVGLLTRKTK